ncbi:MAG: rod shape-determining protein RodA [Patescibacteria group bacterium]
MDWILFFCVLTLVCFGLSAIYSVDLSRESVDLANVKKQLIALSIASVFVVVMLCSNYKFLEHYAVPLYVLGVVLLLGVLVFGQTIRGSRGWFVFGSVSFQPVEFMKLALIIFLARYYGRVREYFGWSVFLKSFLFTLIPVCITLLQPDFGSAIILLGIWFMMAMFAGMQMKQLGTFVFGSFFAFIFSWFFLFAPYQKSRIATFFHPSADLLGQGYNVAQAVIAIGSGGWFGRGLGFGTQSQLKFLPESHTDFIVAVIAEELGFVGMILLIGAFMLLTYRLFHLVKNARDHFTAFVLLGSISVIFLHILVNIGMNLGVFPVTGIGLPYVSYGGSSLIFFLFLFGLAQSISVRTAQVVS